MRRVWVALAIGLVVILGSGSAEAQFSGGSMGGGSWGGGSSWSGGSSWGGGSSWSSSSWGSSGGFSSSGGSADCSGASQGEMVAIIIIVLIVLAVKAAIYFAKSSSSLEYSASNYGYGGRTYTPKVDVSVLRLAIDWNQRAHVQREMERIAKTVDMSTSSGLLQMLREVALVLRRSKDSWLYASVTDAQPMSQSQAEGFFTAQANDARSRFKAELIRAGASGVSTQETPDHLIAGYDEGEGLVVITIVMAVKGEFNDFGLMDSVETVRAWFEGLDYVNSSSLVACEVVWSPAAENDRMSSAELVVLYPGMKKLHHGILSGRAECEYCHGHFPAELVTCPHCGGKVSEKYKAA